MVDLPESPGPMITFILVVLLKVISKLNVLQLPQISIYNFRELAIDIDIIMKKLITKGGYFMQILRRIPAPFARTAKHAYLW